MDNKLLLADLVQILADKGFPRKEAEVFARCFFQQVEKCAFAGETVKINGLGTFKLQKVESRKSVNVHTGEEFNIDEHYKFSYVPDADLKEAVNKPYAHFDNVEVDETPSSPLFSVYDSEKASGDEVKPAQPVVPAPPVSIHRDAVPEPEEGTGLDMSLNREEIAAEEPGPESSLVGLVFKVLGTCLLLGGIIYMFMHSESRKTTYKDAPQITIVKDSVDVAPVTAKVEKPAVEKVEKPAEQTTIQASTSVSAATAPALQTDNDLILLIGSDPLTWETATKVKVRRGDRLVNFSLQNYGEKVFWTYLYLANRDILSNPNSLPEGTVIRIPKAPKSVVNANDPASLTKARAVEVRLKERYD